MSRTVTTLLNRGYIAAKLDYSDFDENHQYKLSWSMELDKGWKVAEMLQIIC